MFSLKYLKEDLGAGLVVYLVALPLCLGIALASGAPLIAGLVCGIVGGTVVAYFSGSEVSVSGPAAGLTVIVASGIAACGSYESFLIAVIFAGALQILMGSLKAGSLAGLFPNSVINGMLTAIGIIIILKQIPHGLGRDDDYEGDMNFFQVTDKEDTISSLFKAFFQVDTGIFILFIISLTLLFAWNSKKMQKIRLVKGIPAPLLVVLLGVVINKMIYAPSFPDWFISPNSGHLVNIPILSSTAQFFSILPTPEIVWSKMATVFSVGLTIAIVASIETLLCVEAGDKIDPQGRTSEPNKELKAQGMGNIVSGLLGGLPMTAVIVRTSANVYAGAKTRLSIVVHGILLLLSILVVAQYLNEIPLASLAAILVHIGYKLVNIPQVKRYKEMGMDQLIPFGVTVIVVVFTDLLAGVFSGLVASLFFAIGRNYQSAIRLVTVDNVFRIVFSRDVTFVNKVKLKKILATIPTDVHVQVDGTKARFVDHDVLEVLQEFKSKADQRNIKVEFTGLDSSPESIERKQRLLRTVSADHHS